MSRLFDIDDFYIYIQGPGRDLTSVASEPSNFSHLRRVYEKHLAQLPRVYYAHIPRRLLVTRGLSAAARSHQMSHCAS